MSNGFLLDDVVINLIGLKADEEILPPDQVVSIVTRIIADLQVYKNYRVALLKHSIGGQYGER